MNQETKASPSKTPHSTPSKGGRLNYHMMDFPLCMQNTLDTLKTRRIVQGSILVPSRNALMLWRVLAPAIVGNGGVAKQQSPCSSLEIGRSDLPLVLQNITQAPSSLCVKRLFIYVWSIKSWHIFISIYWSINQSIYSTSFGSSFPWIHQGKS